MKLDPIESLGLPILHSAQELAWRDDAACKGQDAEMFLPEGKFPVGSSDYKKFIAKALAYCGACPVQDDCLQFGMTQRMGIYGGRTSSQRAAMRKNNRSALRVVNVIRGK